MKTFLSLLLVVLALVGMLDAGYLTYEKVAGVLPPCGAGFDCGQVLNSPWASVGPIPLSALGFLFYTTVLVIACMNFLDIQMPNNVVPAKKMLLIMCSFGFLFSLYLIGVMAFVLQAWCLYCLVSAFISTSLCLTSLTLNLVKEPASTE